MGQVLDGGEDNSSTSDVNNNADAGAGNTSGIGDVGATDGVDNNFDNKNAHAKTSFSTYNIANANTDANTGDTIDTKDDGDISGVDNNIDGKNLYAKTGLSTYNIISLKVDVGIGVSDTSGMAKKVNNNTNNTGEGQSERVSGTNEDGVCRTNIKVGVGVAGANKCIMGEAEIKAGKNASAKNVTSINNSADGGRKIINQYVGFTSLVFATLTAANYADISNLTIPESTPPGTITTTSDEFLATFATLFNTTLGKKQVYKSNPFLFTAIRQ